MATLSLQSVTKRFGALGAVEDVTLEISSGEFFSILGPSGCGKTTLLRMIAGFETPTSGSIVLGGKNLAGVPAKQRDIGMVFQNYALFPHMTVFQNVAFGLETRGVSREETGARVMDILSAVHMIEKAQTPVPTLSGGEQQRVAVARALVIQPDVLLFDEPLSNLDIALRARTREEIHQLQRRTGITTVYVTHDQAEAMGLSDRIAVLNHGRLIQVGTPAEIYDHPADRFVAEFVGSGNILEGKMLKGELAFLTGTIRIPVPANIAREHGGSTILSLKPEAVSIGPHGISDGELSGTVVDKEYLGFTTHLVLDVAGLRLRVSSLSSKFTQEVKPGDRTTLTIDWTRAVFLT